MASRFEQQRQDVHDAYEDLRLTARLAGAWPDFGAGEDLAWLSTIPDAENHLARNPLLFMGLGQASMLLAVHFPDNRAATFIRFLEEGKITAVNRVIGGVNPVSLVMSQLRKLVLPQERVSEVDYRTLTAELQAGAAHYRDHRQ